MLLLLLLLLLLTLLQQALEKLLQASRLLGRQRRRRRLGPLRPRRRAWLQRLLARLELGEPLGQLLEEGQGRRRSISHPTPWYWPWRGVAARLHLCPVRPCP